MNKVIFAIIVFVFLLSLFGGTQIRGESEKINPLTILKEGNGRGYVSGWGIDCGLDCEELYPFGTWVTLRAAPLAGFVFDGWSDCDFSTGTTCDVFMTYEKFIFAYFFSDSCFFHFITGFWFKGKAMLFADT